jgi:hypothetical protein
MTGILEKPTTNSSGSNVHCLFSVRNMFFSYFGTGRDNFSAGFEMESGWILNLWAASL